MANSKIRNTLNCQEASELRKMSFQNQLLQGAFDNNKSIVFSNFNESNTKGDGVVPSLSILNMPNNVKLQKTFSN